MTASQARKLKVGDAVVCTIDNVRGVVIEIGTGGVMFKWSDGVEGWIDFNDMAIVKAVSA